MVVGTKPAIRNDLILARRLAAERRDLIQGLIADGWSQADVGRELGVSRQAIQKMLAC